MKTKKIIIGMSSIAACAVLAYTTFAMFTSRNHSEFIATAGNVSVNVSDLTMTNAGNINPGDNDPSNLEGATEGTDHLFEYKISNLGNKSIRTRHTLILTAKDAENKEKVLDARWLALFDENLEVVDKYYVLEDDSEVKVTKDTEIPESFVKAVKYVFLSDVFNGRGTPLEEGGDAEIETLENVISADAEGNVSKTYSFDFSLLKPAGNSYQGADFNLDVIVEAMQYRNTVEEDWVPMTTASKSFSSINGTYVPARDEDSEGNKLPPELVTPVNPPKENEEVKPSPEEKPAPEDTVKPETDTNKENSSEDKK